MPPCAALSWSSACCCCDIPKRRDFSRLRLCLSRQTPPAPSAFGSGTGAAAGLGAQLIAGASSALSCVARPPAPHPYLSESLAEVPAAMAVDRQPHSPRNPCGLRLPSMLLRGSLVDAPARSRRLCHCVCACWSALNAEPKRPSLDVLRAGRASRAGIGVRRSSSTEAGSSCQRNGADQHVNSRADARARRRTCGGGPLRDRAPAAAAV